MTPDPGTKWHDPALLDHLVRVRRPWDTLVRRVVRATLKRYLSNPPGVLVEIGGRRRATPRMAPG
jgi:hypothetical protein